jgi:hypothetical protein
MSIESIFTPKQLEVLKAYKDHKPKLMVLNGGKRAGKTFVAVYIFLLMVLEKKNQGVKFILGGNTYSSIRRNILDDLETLIGRKLTFQKDNSFELFGNKIVVSEGKDSGSYKKIRG